MFPYASLLTMLILALSFAGSITCVNPEEFVKLELQRRIDVSSAYDLVRRDKARARSLRARGQASAGSNRDKNVDIIDPLDNQVVTYIASVGVGSPATTYKLIVDTGSSNTWIGATTPYIHTSTSSKTGQSVSVNYGSRSFSALEYTDTVIITDDLAITGQSIGVANEHWPRKPYSGQVFLFFTEYWFIFNVSMITQGTLSPSTSQAIPTVADNAFAQGLISTNLIGISFDPTIQNGVNAELSWGGVDDFKFTGELTYAPLTSTSPASRYWGFDQSITYGPGNTPILSSTAGIVDCGTSFIYLATDAFNRYVEATGAKLDSAAGFLMITSENFDSLQSLFFNIEGVAFEFTADAQICPRSLNSAIGSIDGMIYLVVADLGENSGSGLDFICGYVFLERFYTVYDSENCQVGFATTPFTDATINQCQLSMNS